ncbi:MAG: peptidoglycan DD-metalloendopeptidase family protein [Rhodobacteraceae bacterium]|nr:peptidoglycan DD-metalloendopeptidase family protein [Paracoccaceae bacterium]
MHRPKNEADGDDSVTSKNLHGGQLTVVSRVAHRVDRMLERRFPERRLFLRSDADMRFIRLSPTTQLVAWTGGALVTGWTIIASAILLMDNIGSGSIRDQAEREQALYEERINQLAAERNLRAQEAIAAQERFNIALGQISEMQSALLASEDRRKELETGIEVIQATLRRTMQEREEANEEVAALESKLNATEVTSTERGRIEDMSQTLDILALTLNDTASQRDAAILNAIRADDVVEQMALDHKLMEERNDRIFAQLEDAVSVSLEPLDKMFRAAGLPTDDIIDSIRRGYSGTGGGPLTPITFSTKGEPLDSDSVRANSILEQMDRMNLYRIAAEKLPFSLPLRTSFRYTSGFGPRWGRMHQGTDFAGAHGSPILATGDGVVTHAGWAGAYGRLVKIRHEFGIETRYAHMSEIHVQVGQRVSRGDRIGDMGNTGRSTGTHLHYEVRVNGSAVNPMTYIKAGRDVF